MSDERDKILLEAYKRFKDLIDGNRLAETLEDDVFLSAYEAGVMEIAPLEFYLTICDNRAIMELELHAAWFGYSIGYAHGSYSIDGSDETITH